MVGWFAPNSRVFGETTLWIRFQSMYLSNPEERARYRALRPEALRGPRIKSRGREISPEKSGQTTGTTDNNFGSMIRVANHNGSNSNRPTGRLINADLILNFQRWTEVGQQKV